MIKKSFTAVGKLNKVKDTFFTVKGSPCFFIPVNEKMLHVLKGIDKGVQLKLTCYKTSKDSVFVRVRHLYVDRRNNNLSRMTS